MSSCRDCQHQLGDDDRFCSQCGSLQSEEIEVLGAEKATTSSTVARSGPSSATLALGAAGLVLAVLLWAFVGRGDVEGVDEAADENAEQAVADDTATTERPDDNDEPMATTRMHGTDGDDDEEDDVNGDADEEADETEGGPLLGREVGLTLLVGGPSDLVEIDLDSGEKNTYRLNGLNPVVRSGDWLVLNRRNDSSLSAIPIDNLALAPVSLDVSMTWAAALSPDTDPDYLWVLAETEDPDVGFVPLWKRVRLIDGEVVEEVETGASAFFGAAEGPQLASAPDGGIYERVDGDYRRVANGALVAVADDRVIVQDCASPTTCTAYWLDRSSWERIDGPDLPEEVQLTFGVGWLSSGGRIFTSWGFDGPRVLDLERGEEVDLSNQNWEFGPGAVSPDERFLVSVRGGHPEILDLDSGETYAINAVAMSGEYRAILVESSP